jgi:hypothetical protein
MVTQKGSMSTEEGHSKFLPYLTSARYVHPSWSGGSQSCKQVRATQGKSRGIGGTYTRAPYATRFTTTAMKDRGGSRCYRPPDVATCGRNLITGLTSAASPRVGISRTCKVGQKLGVSFPLLTCSLRRDHPGFCTAEVRNAGGTYKLPCMFIIDVAIESQTSTVLLNKTNKEHENTE